MPKLYISTNDPRQPRVTETTTFYFVDYEIDGPLVARMLALQSVRDMMEVALRHLSERRLSNAEAAQIVEELWQETEKVYRRFDGGSAEAKREKPATAAPTSTPSPSPSKKQESRSSTRRRRTKSTSRQAVATSAEPVGKTEKSTAG